MKAAITALTLAGVIAMAGCQGVDRDIAQGTALGAAAGGVIGAVATGDAGGALAGAVIGGVPVAAAVTSTIVAVSSVAKAALFVLVTSWSPVSAGKEIPVAFVAPAASPTTCKSVAGVVVPIPRLPSISIRSASLLFVRKTKGCASIVPTNSVVGFVPILPVRCQPDDTVEESKAILVNSVPVNI